MTNKEQTQRDIAIAFDFIEQIIEDPDMVDEIPEGAAISFLDDENVKPEKRSHVGTSPKYVKVKRHFEVL